MLSKNVNRVFFWHLKPTGNRLEYSLQLIDKRLVKMFDSEKVIILSHYHDSWWPTKRKLTIELFVNYSAAKQQMKHLIGEQCYTNEHDYRFKTKRIKSKWNPALIYPFTKIIISSFASGRQPVIVAFQNEKERANFLLKLNEATKQYINANLEMWDSANF